MRRKDWRGRERRVAAVFHKRRKHSFSIPVVERLLTEKLKPLHEKHPHDRGMERAAIIQEQAADHQR